ncbi:epoxide hydrolase family protein [Streptomyces sp. CA-106131]|uniref:epoxide hydrolase family protein n=1 Tax=Streptomyces sp. CA-106131 TaxID=3240045 RepID=UPI003D8A9127
MEIRPFTPEFDAEAVADLRRRVAGARWPEPQTVAGWEQGVPEDYLRDLVGYWADGYDWTAANSRLQRLPQYKTSIDGLDIHFAHLPSPVPTARPLVLTHGWPGSYLEFLEVAEPLADPERFGGDPADAFHVVVPSLPGFGFSGKPSGPGWGAQRIATAWVELMRRLGYERFYAQGGDMGFVVSLALAKQHPEQVRAIHLNFWVSGADPTAELAGFGELTEEEHSYVAKAHKLWSQEVAYSILQSSKPQTIGYALAGTPIGQAAWIVEKFHGWTDNSGLPEDAVARDRILDIIGLYWFGNLGASSARLYWESTNAAVADHSAVTVPVGYSVFPAEILGASERWARLRFPELRYYAKTDRGGHFAALEEPGIFLEEVRASFRAVEAAGPTGL